MTLRLPTTERTSYVAAGTLSCSVPDDAVVDSTSLYVPAAASVKSAPYGELPEGTPPGMAHDAAEAITAACTVPDGTVVRAESVPASDAENV
jgi:hypothetical protein